MSIAVELDMPRIEEYCRKWKIKSFALFGSVLREDFRPDSDVDVLIEFEPEMPWSLYDWMDMKDELVEMFGRKVDLVEKEGLRNPIRRKEILGTNQVIYEGQ